MIDNDVPSISSERPEIVCIPQQPQTSSLVLLTAATTSSSSVLPSSRFSVRVLHSDRKKPRVFQPNAVNPELRVGGVRLFNALNLGEVTIYKRYFSFEADASKIWDTIDCAFNLGDVFHDRIYLYACISMTDNTVPIGEVFLVFLDFSVFDSIWLQSDNATIFDTLLPTALTDSSLSVCDGLDHTQAKSNLGYFGTLEGKMRNILLKIVKSIITETTGVVTRLCDALAKNGVHRAEVKRDIIQQEQQLLLMAPNNKDGVADSASSQTKDCAAPLILSPSAKNTEIKSSALKNVTATEKAMAQLASRLQNDITATAKYKRESKPPVVFVPGGPPAGLTRPGDSISDASSPTTPAVKKTRGGATAKIKMEQVVETDTRGGGERKKRNYTARKALESPPAAVAVSSQNDVDERDKKLDGVMSLLQSFVANSKNASSVPQLEPVETTTLRDRRAEKANDKRHADEIRELKQQMEIDRRNYKRDMQLAQQSIPKKAEESLPTVSVSPQEQHLYPPPQKPLPLIYSTQPQQPMYQQSNSIIYQAQPSGGFGQQQQPTGYQQHLQQPLPVYHHDPVSYYGQPTSSYLIQPPHHCYPQTNGIYPSPPAFGYAPHQQQHHHQQQYYSGSMVMPAPHISSAEKSRLAKRIVDCMEGMLEKLN